MILFKRLSFYLALAGIAGGFFLVKKLRYQAPPPPPYQEPARSPFPYAVAATGILEATRENVRIGATKSGLVQKVFVAVGSKVKAGDPLMQFDNREMQAKLETVKAQLEALEATAHTEEVQLADANDQLARILKLEKSNVATEEEKTRKQFQVEASKARIAKIKADAKALQSQIHQVETDLDILTVRAPRDGTILQVNIRAGEYANVTSQDPWIILGDVDTLQIRADVDEQDAPLVLPNQAAFAYLKGDTKNKIPLRFIRIEPFVVPKKSLTGDSAERVDTRVLQIIFEMDRPQTPIYVGQQVDVYIQRPEPTKTALK
ncbi:MAG: Secretion protein HlyD family protein [Verrucomicrobiales bacterium]|nr:Secretion protein HlyD family protein [Verrucomicrobiales bacterium]